MTWLPTLRLATFATVALFAFIVMSISADLIRNIDSLTGGISFGFSAFALATSIITLITIIPMYLIDMSRQGAISSYIAVEIGWLSVLWVFWLSAASYTASFDGEATCNFDVFGDSVFTQICQEIKAITAFSFLTWLILMVYIGALLFLAIRAQGRGNNVWKASVRDEAIFYSEAKSGGTLAQMHTMPTSVSQAYPPAPAPAPHSVPTPGAIQV